MKYFCMLLKVVKFLLSYLISDYTSTMPFSCTAMA